MTYTRSLRQDGAEQDRRVIGCIRAAIDARADLISYVADQNA